MLRRRGRRGFRRGSQSGFSADLCENLCVLCVRAKALVAALSRYVSVVLFFLTLVAFAQPSFQITEFMAANSGSLLDEDGDSSDWIEIQNASTNVANLGGWFLTDTPGWLTKWQFPVTNLAPDSFLVVFASSKNRVVPGAPLHTNFRLNKAGGYLALVQPDGVTVASEFAAYPPQVTGVSFGLGLGASRTSELLVGTNAPIKFLIPSAPVSDAWRGGAVFDDSSWSNGAFSVGFDVNTGAVTVAYVTPTNTLGNQAFGGSLGMDFVVTRPVVITELGCFDSGGDGIASGMISVQLWRRNDNGTPDNPADDSGIAMLASADFTTASPGTLADGNRFKPLATPLTLTNGAFTIVASGYSSAEPNGNNGGGAFVPLTLNSGGTLQFVGRSRFGSAGAFPGSPDSKAAQYGAGTFRFQAAPVNAFNTSLVAMQNVNASAMVRVPLTVPAGASYASLALQVSYDDGFVAWLNGVEVVRRNAPDVLAFNAAATNVASVTETMDLSAFPSLLRLGATNILALHGLNVNASDGDFRLDARLSAERYTTQQVFFATPTPGVANSNGLLAARVLINEIHSDPTNSKSFNAEFIELYNPLPTNVNLSAWSFTKGVSFAFAPGTSIPANGFLVIAAEPSVVQQVFGVMALGPWTGSLANDGETLELTDASRAVVDSVTYGLGFPWPTVGDAPGYSMQLLNEGQDNDLGGAWRAALPTPGARNAVATSAVPPQVRQVDHAPSAPRSGDTVTITAKVTDPDGVASVTLEYQIVEPGYSIRLTDAAFTNNWTSIPMRDDGLAGDAVAFDSVFAAQIPASAQMHRRLIRYRITATDRLGNFVCVPYAEDPSANFAYFVYDGVPAWTGAVQPGVTSPQTFDTNTMRKVRAFHLVSQSNDVWNCQFNPAYNGLGYVFEGAVVMDGVVYDHVHYEVAGQNSTYATGKNKWRFRFNRGHWLPFVDNNGQPLQTTRETLKLSALTEPWAVWNRGLAGLDEAFLFRLNNLAGVAAPESTHLQLRVIDDATETNPASQYDGDLWGLYLGFEVYDQNFKTEHGMPDGNLFYMQGGGANNLGAQGAGQPADLSDLNSFISTVTGYNATPTQPLAWWRTNVDLLAYYSWRTVVEAVNDGDKRDQENVTYFRDPLTGLWSVHPWDEDLLYEQFDRWGPQGVQTTANVPLEQFRRCLEISDLNIKFQNRARELQDLLLNTNQAWRLIDELVSHVTDGGVTNPGFAEVERRRWDYDPANPIPPRADRATGNYYRTPFPILNMGNGPLPQPFYRTLVSADFVGMVAWVKNFIISDAHGGARLATMVSDSTIPNTPTVSYTGQAGYPSDGLVFDTSAFSSPSSRGFAAMQWRIGEIYDPNVPGYVTGTPNRYEIENLWTSAELTTFNSRVTIPPAYAQAGHTYRVRVKFKDNSGRWSRWSAPVEFTAGVPAVALLSQNLVVTEIMYNPPDCCGYTGDNLEFLELKNVGTNTLDLSGLTFSAGITFTFTNGTPLAPHATFLLARNTAAMAAKYPGVVVNGLYTGKLNNAGDTLTLSETGGAVVWSFAYDDTAPWPVTADGWGFSLVLANPQPGVDFGNAANWRASSVVGGSPGATDPANTIPPVVINEVLTHSETNLDWIELFNPTTNTVDIGGWFLTDDPATPLKFRVPTNTWLGPLGFVVFDETQFNPTPGTNHSFSLSSLGESVYLFSGNANTNLTGYSHGFAFGAAALGETFGRYVNSIGEEQFPAPLAPTPAAPNSGPRVGPVVITEIHYHPALGGDEFVELKNITTNTVPLYDPTNILNAWRLNGVGFTFPTNIELGPEKFLVLVATNPATFRAKYAVPSNVQILGPYSGRLQGGGERLELQRLEVFGTNGPAYVTVDEVRYNNQVPWPTVADGTGPSLQRKVPGAYGNDPVNWMAGYVSPGADLVVAEAPTILTQPQGRSVAPGSNVTFSVTAAGTPPLNYQWRFNNNALGGPAASTLTLTNAQLAHAGFYSVLVFNDAGSALSSNAQLIVLQPPVITAQPTNQFVKPTSNAVFSVSATGTGALQYQWRLNGTNLANATNTLLTITNAQWTNAGAYTVLITDNLGSTLSAAVVLALLIDPTIVQQPLSQTVVSNGNVTFSVSVTNTATLPVGFRWRRQGSYLPGAFFVLNERTCFFTVTNAQPAYTIYSVTVTNASRPGGLNSASATLTFLTDSDGDSLPNNWEQTYFSSTTAGDPLADSDGDGMLNWQEYVAGTNPTNALSYLKLDATSTCGSATLTFEAVSNRTYSIFFTDGLEPSAWTKLADFVARTTNRLESIPDLNAKTNRFYRIITPQQP